MARTTMTRLGRLLPDGLPRWVRIYDNGGPDARGGSIDRYTVVFTGTYGHKTGGETLVLAMNCAPFHPQGFGQHCNQRQRPDCPRYGHLGKKIRFVDLPTDCQIAALADYLYLWDLAEENESQAKAREMVKSRAKGNWKRENADDRHPQNDKGRDQAC